MTGSDHPSTCFVSLGAYPMLSGRADICHIGGAEVQQVHIARGLVKRGYRVSFVTLDHGQTDGAEIDGIRIFKAYEASAGVRGFRFLHPRWTGLCQAMKRADADVYYQRCASAESGQVCSWCRANRRRFLYALASTADWDPTVPGLENCIERAFYRYALRHADRVVAKTRTQQQGLARWHDRDSVVIRSCQPLPQIAESDLARPSVPPNVLWVGRFGRSKRLELCLDVASVCPEFRFLIAGSANAASDYAARLQRRASQIPNVSLLGYVPYQSLPDLYRGALVLLCTSSAEGFPNTFLEAWSYGRPVVSTLDPDGLIAAHGLGEVTEGLDQLRSALLRFFQNGDRWRTCAASARRYVALRHSVQEAVSAYEQVLLDLTQKAPR